MAESQRHLARILVLKAIYAADHSEDDYPEAFDKLKDDAGLNQKSLKFATDLFTQSVAKKVWAFDNITRLAENWKLKRIADIDRTIMQMAMVELDTMVDTPYKVVINEAIELAKEFSSGESSKFINGIVDSFVKETIEVSGD